MEDEPNILIEDLYEEKNEYNEKTRKIGEKLRKELDETFKKIDSENRTRRVAEGRTRRVGESTESTIIDDFWEYYKQFSSEKMPDPNHYFGGDQAELNITVLIRLFESYYNEFVYPFSSRFPIVHYSFRQGKKQLKKRAKIFLVGDTHGSYKDTVKLIPYFVSQIEEWEPKGVNVKIIFIGDFVDRGIWDLHNLLHIMTFNLKYPKNVLLLRGNHEEIGINAHYGFGNRVISNLSKITYANFNQMFADLPLICTILTDNANIMCLHGGIPFHVNDSGDVIIPNLNNHEFRNRKVFLENMDEISQQILWNDPLLKYDKSKMNPYYPSRRGIGYEFGKEIFDKFCEINHVQLVFRGHQVFREGYHLDFENRFITIFSASEYVGKQLIGRFVEIDTTEAPDFEIHTIQTLPG